MMPDSTGGDLRSVWKSQRKENTAMSAQELRTKVERYRARARREEIAAFIIALVIMAFCVAILVKSVGREGPGPVVMAMVVLIIGNLGRVVHTSYKTNERIWPWPARISPSVTLSATCVAFYRKGLERQRRGHEKDPWDLAILVVLFLVVFLPLFLRRMLPALPVVLIAVFICLAFLARLREARRIHRELDALNTFEKEGNP